MKNNFKFITLIFFLFNACKKSPSTEQVNSTTGQISFSINGVNYNYTVNSNNGFLLQNGSVLPCSTYIAQRVFIAHDSLYQNFVEFYLNTDSMHLNLDYKGDSLICTEKYNQLRIIPMFNNKIYNVGNSNTHLTFTNKNNNTISGTFNAKKYVFGYYDSIEIVNGSFTDIPFE